MSKEFSLFISVVEITLITFYSGLRRKLRKEKILHGFVVVVVVVVAALTFSFGECLLNVLCCFFLKITSNSQNSFNVRVRLWFELKPSP